MATKLKGAVRRRPFSSLGFRPYGVEMQDPLSEEKQYGLAARLQEPKDAVVGAPMSDQKIHFHLTANGWHESCRLEADKLNGVLPLPPVGTLAIYELHIQRGSGLTKDRRMGRSVAVGGGNECGHTSRQDASRTSRRGMRHRRSRSVASLATQMWSTALKLGLRWMQSGRTTFSVTADNHARTSLLPLLCGSVKLGLF